MRNQQPSWVPGAATDRPRPDTRRTRSYRGRTLQEALAKVRVTLGDGAFLLGTKRRPKYWLFGPPQIEVLAMACDRRSEDEVSELSRPSNLPVAPAQNHPPATKGAAACAEPMTGTPAIQHTLAELLAAAGVLPGTAALLARRALEGERRMLEARQLVASLAAAIASLIGGTAPVEAIAGARRVVCFVGPPGSGKTTALTKLACQLALGQGYRVDLLNTDNARPGAADQLARFAAILDVDFANLHTPGELRQRATASSADVVLVDTPGCSWRSGEDLNNLASLLEAAGAAEVHLVIPATYDPNQVGHLTAALRHLGLDRLLLTRLDETESYGPAVNLMCQARLPLSYLSGGSAVPGQLQVPVLGELAEALVTGRAPVSSTSSPNSATSNSATYGGNGSSGDIAAGLGLGYREEVAQSARP